MTPMRTLYVDMDSFFASVERQMDPALRGRPVAVTALDAAAGSVVAASLEAKAAGVRTGTPVREAARLCPGIALRPSRHRLYVRVNRRIAGVIDGIAELERVRSVDEFQVALGGSTSELGAALDLGRRIRAAIRDRVGSELAGSVGIGPNPLLAKIAGKLGKPDGLEWLAPENMPERVAHLPPEDLPGISRGIGGRLRRAGVRDVGALYGLDPRHARLIWRSVEGERFVRALRGMEVSPGRTRRGGYGSSKVLAPDFRSPDRAYPVARWLTGKAVERMRRDGYCARRLTLSLRTAGGGRWSRGLSRPASQDSRAFLRRLGRLWDGAPLSPGSVVIHVGVRVDGLVELASRSGDLFAPAPPGTPGAGERLCHAVDGLNARFGRGTVTFGRRLEHPGFFERG